MYTEIDSDTKSKSYLDWSNRCCPPSGAETCSLHWNFIVFASWHNAWESTRDFARDRRRSIFALHSSIQTSFFFPESSRRIFPKSCLNNLLKKVNSNEGQRLLHSTVFVWTGHYKVSIIGWQSTCCWWLCPNDFISMVNWWLFLAKISVIFKFERSLL